LCYFSVFFYDELHNTITILNIRGIEEEKYKKIQIHDW
jgi:hypothetical protein